MSGRLEGKAVIVTGGGSGIGEAIVRRFVEEGAAVLVPDIRLDAAEAVAGSLGEGARAMVADIREAGDWGRVVAEMLEWRGRVDVLVNNAGVGTTGERLADVEEGEWDRVLSVDLKGVFRGMKAVLPVMREAGRGSVVNIASAAGLVAWRGTSAYTTAKGGVVAMTRATAAEYAEMGVRVNCICPSVVRSPLMERVTGGTLEGYAPFMRGQPIRRPGLPSDVAGMAVYLASDEAEFVTGAAYVVDGGYTAV